MLPCGLCFAGVLTELHMLSLPAPMLLVGCCSSEQRCSCRRPGRQSGRGTHPREHTCAGQEDKHACAVHRHDVPLRHIVSHAVHAGLYRVPEHLDVSVHAIEQSASPNMH